MRNYKASCKYLLKTLSIVLLPNIKTFDLYNYDFSTIPEYDYNSNEKTAIDLRKIFLNKQEKIRETEKKVNLLKMYTSTDMIYIDDIAHSAANETHPAWEKIKVFEDAFKKIIAMEGVKYIYKRDMYWRTWRELKYPNGSSKIVCYKCNNLINLTKNCSHCRSSGFWVIEEKPPPCPYEIFSMIDNDVMCGTNYTQYKTNDPCSSIINFNELTSTCNNPIKTKWRITSNYKRNYERSVSVICGGRDYCEFTTYYLIQPDSIIFRIFNMTNDVIYSRIMRSGKKNYACVEDCGHINPDTLAVTRSQKTLILNLLDTKSHKKKRENRVKNHNKISESFTKKTVNKKKKKSNIWQFNVLSNNSISIPNLKQRVNFKKNDSFTFVLPASKTETDKRSSDSLETTNMIETPFQTKIKPTTMSSCKRIIEQNNYDGSDE